MNKCPLCLKDLFSCRAKSRKAYARKWLEYDSIGCHCGWRMDKKLFDSILATARAEALRNAADKLETMRTEWTAKHLSTWREYDAGYTTGLSQLASIIGDKP